MRPVASRELLRRPSSTFDGTRSILTITHTRTGVPDGGSGFDGGKLTRIMTWGVGSCWQRLPLTVL